MIDLSILALFALACLALTATPGPDMLLIASRSASQGKASGFATLAGIQLGTYCHALAAAFGLSQLFLIVPLAYDVVRYADGTLQIGTAKQARAGRLAWSLLVPRTAPLGVGTWSVRCESGIAGKGKFSVAPAQGRLPTQMRPAWWQTSRATRNDPTASAAVAPSATGSCSATRPRRRTR